MNQQPVTLDQAPPDWGQWRAAAAEYAREVNAIQPARRKQPEPTHPDLLTRYTAEEIASLEVWLAKD